jgi:outer membrane protein assembly factor BamB
MVVVRRLSTLALSALWILAACTSAGPGPSPSPPTQSASSIPPSSPARGTWTTYHRDLARSGFDRSSPPVGSVRRAWTSVELDGDVYAQPLVFKSRVLVATENDSVYAFDARTGRAIWRTHLGEPVPRSALPCGNIDPTGITGTPALDPSTGVLYVVTFVQPGRHELVAIDSDSGRIRFRHDADAAGADPLVHQQRGALAIANGRVYAPYGGLFGDCGDYHGVVVGVSLDGTGPLLSYRVPSERAAGIWAPSGPAVEDSGNVLVSTGNSFSSTYELGNSVLRLSPTLRLLDSFAPSNWLALNQGDVDVGSVGPALLSGGLVFQAGKEGVGYLLHGDDLGGIGGEAFSARVCAQGGVFGGTAWAAPFVYVPCSDGLVALRVTSAPSFTVAWRADGFFAGPPIVAGGAAWTVDTGSGELIAFDARTGGRQFATSLGSVAHFTSPTAAAGRLYVAALRRVIAFWGI